MKKKLFLIAAMAFVFAMLFAFAVSADTVHTPERLAKYGTTVTVRVTEADPDGTTVNLFDSEGNALIWYLDSSNQLQSIRADDQRVKYKVEDWGEVTSVYIALDGTTTIGAGKFVVLNVLDDDVLMNDGSSKHIGTPFNYFKLVFQGCTNLEYVYLRLDTVKIQRQSFNGCSNLKYINLEDLTEVTRIGDSQHFSGCSKLFVGQVLDLSRLTKLTSIDGGGTFNAVPLAGIILPNACTSLGTWTFQSNPTTSFRFYAPSLTSIPGSTFKYCTNLQTVYLNGTLSSIGDDAFNSCNALTTICFVGTKDQLKTLIANTSATGNTPFLNVAGALGADGEYANVISYADYLKLSDEKKSSGKYAIYNYSYCEAYNNGVHTAVDNANDCTKNADCRVCGLEEAIEAEFENHNYLETLVYENGFAQAGVYTYICQNSEKCTCGNITASKDAIFVATGFSTKGADGISAGYSVVPELVTEYNRINKDNKITFGVMMVSPTFLSEKDSFFKDGKVNAEKYLQVDMTGIAYKNLSVHVTGFVDTARNASLVMALYVCDGDGNVEFVQSQITPCADKSVTLGKTTLYTVTLDSVTNESTTVGNLKDYFAKEEEE
jgi:hypothetical protein